MRFDKVIFLRYIPLTEKICRDFNMNSIIGAGIKVEYWDFTALFFDHPHDQEDSSHIIDTLKFNTYNELELAIAAQDRSRTLFVSIVTYEMRVVKLFKLLTKYSCTLGVFGRNMFPAYHSMTERKSFFERLLRVTPRKVLNVLEAKWAVMLKRTGAIKCYDIIFQGGSQGWRGIGQVEYTEVERAERVMVNSDDYDNYLRLRDAPRLIPERYVLFLDEYLPLHPDAALFGIRNITPDEYYLELNSYFDRVEARFGMPVVIAAHPKAFKYNEHDYFNGRQIYFGKSAELSRDAHFVLAHDSTSINYPIAFGVRLHFITSHNIERTITQVHLGVISFSEYLGCNWQYFDNPNEPINVVEALPEQNYQNYKYEFQCSKETESQQTKEIVIKFLTE